MHGDVQVAGRSAARTWSALARDPQPRPISHALRHPHRDGPGLGGHAGAQAGRARLVDHLAGALTDPAGLAEPERTLVVADEPRTAAVGADVRRGSGLRADSAAGADRYRAGKL